MAFQFYYPSIIVCKPGARHLLSEIVYSIIGKKDHLRIMVVTGRSLRYQSLLEECRVILKGNTLYHFSAIDPEPTLSHVDHLIQTLRDQGNTLHQWDCMIAIGGGSVIDVAKAAAAITPYGYHSHAYFTGEKEIPGLGIPLIALPTTAGTGAEITRNSVLIDPTTKIKQSIRSPFMVPKAAICDAELTYQIPPSITASTGLDALTQAIESYLSKNANEITQSFAVKSIRKIMAGLPKIFTDPDNHQARQEVCEGSLLSAMSFSQAGLGAVHGLAHPIGALLGIPHGLCCAILLPYVLQLNYTLGAQQIIHNLAQELGYSSASFLIDAIKKLLQDLCIPETFQDYNLSDQHFPFILAHCRSNSMRSNPVELSDEKITHLLHQLSCKK